MSFSQLATAHYAAAKSETPETRAHAKDAYPNLRAAFEARRGAIHSEYFCEEIVAAVVITTDGRVFDVNNPTEATGLQRLYSNLIGRTQEVARLLSGEERMRCN